MKLDIEANVKNMTDQKVKNELDKRGITIARDTPLNIHWHRRYKLKQVMEQEEQENKLTTKEDE